MISQCVEGLVFVFLFIHDAAGFRVQALPQPYPDVATCIRASGPLLRSLHHARPSVKGNTCLTIDEFVEDYRQ